MESSLVLPYSLPLVQEVVQYAQLSCAVQKGLFWAPQWSTFSQRLLQGQFEKQSLFYHLPADIAAHGLF